MPLYLLLLLPALGWTAAVAAAPPDADTTAAAEHRAEPRSGDDVSDSAGEPGAAVDETVTWVDDSHAFATERAQRLTEWMDSFFGDPVYDLEKPESLLRLEWANTWDEVDDYDTRLRLRGKVRLPRLSERINIIFSGEDGDQGVERNQNNQDNAEILYNLGERSRQRFDVTLGLNSGGLKPGVRYRNQGPISDNHRYRYTHRIEWESDEGFYTSAQANLDHVLSDTQLIRWGNRFTYGEETYGLEWRTGLSYQQKFISPMLHDPFVLSCFASMNGFTEPSWVENYRAGLRFRRQLFRRYLFMEVEPSYNLRKRSDENDRHHAWNIILRFEILFETGRRRTPETLSARQNTAPVRNTANSSETD